MKKLVLLLSIATIIGCMALPVSGMVIQSKGLTSQYQGSSMCDRAYATVYNTSSFRAQISVADSRGVLRGTRVWNCGRSDQMLTSHYITSYWVDHAYNNKTAECKELYLF